MSVARPLAFGSPVLSREAAARGTADSRWAFGVFVLITGTLFMRPAEIVPGLVGLPIYQLLNIVCVLLAWPQLARRFEWGRLAAVPIVVCVLGLQLSVVASFVGRFELGDAFAAGNEYFKVVVYFALLVTLVDSTERLRRLLFWLLCFTAGVTLLSLLQYHGYVNIPAMAAVRDVWATEDGGEEVDVAIFRLCASGIFANPNDLSRILDLAIFVAIHFMLAKELGYRRLLWGVPLVMFLYALHLTQSRGGVIGLVAGLAAYGVMRFGKKKALLIGAACSPLLLLVLSARQMEMSTSGGTGQLRIQLWSEGLGRLAHSPLLGIGMDKVDEQIGNGCHNSFVQCFVEEGFIGGSLFAGIFYLAISGLMRARLAAGGNGVAAREAWSFRPCVAAIVIGYGAGMLSSTRSYAVPTYLVLGLAAAYLELLSRVTRVPQTRRFDSWLAMRLGVIGAVALTTIYVYVRMAAKWN